MKNRREELQRKGLNKWALNKFQGTLNWATGVGKTFAAILAIEHFTDRYSEEKVLIVCPTLMVVENFKNEFKKFKKQKLLKKCKFICYASISKEKESYSLVVLDEIHHVTSDLRMTFFNVRKYKAVLGLSASLTPKQRLLLSGVAPIVDKLSLEDVIEEGFVANYTVINIPVELTPGEKADYDKYTETIAWSKNKYGSNAWNYINKRASLLYTAAEKMRLTKKIVDLFPNQYGIIFSLKRTYADKIASSLGSICTSIHSGHSKKQKNAKLKRFGDGRTRLRLISTAKILDEGVTLPRLSYAIQVARYSKERQFLQNLGRLVRPDIKDKHAIIIRIYVKDTVEESWVSYSQQGFNVINVNNYAQLAEKINQKSTIK